MGIVMINCKYFDCRGDCKHPERKTLRKGWLEKIFKSNYCVGMDSLRDVCPLQEKTPRPNPPKGGSGLPPIECCCCKMKR